ncbi:hypothetical protein [Dyella sp. 333MFSha]|uniref:hypothetical protein n=1 Tax=Dyella sp. 333MFSha TaxID=1798240 RepID=UPI00088234E6|nr:hypothetical protein [Dyella sp. 333MFSha]SDG96660.1 hypothetical protein SAMN04515659_3887 [Dyella sp. 333MFSha]
MRVWCEGNTGDHLKDSSLLSGYTEKSRFPLVTGQEYVVFGMALWRDILLLLVSDSNDLPSWIPIELFRFTDSSLPDGWQFERFSSDQDLQALWGYPRLISDGEHYDGLLERDPVALTGFAGEKRRVEGLLSTQ